MKSKSTSFVRSSGNIFADLGLPNPDERLIKADIAALIGKLINLHGLTQKAAAVKLGIAQPDVSRILRGQLSGYSLERLLSLVRAFGNDVEIKVKPAKNANAGHILMSADVERDFMEVLTHEENRSTRVRSLAEKQVRATKDLYERAKDALEATLATWERSFDEAASQGAVALNRKIIDITQRNITSGFELAKSLAGAKNLAEAMELQTSYWQKQLGTLSDEAEEVRTSDELRRGKAN